MMMMIMMRGKKIATIDAKKLREDDILKNEHFC